MELKEVYNKEFYKSPLNYISSKNIFSIFFNWYKPKSIIDIGFGIGYY